MARAFPSTNLKVAFSNVSCARIDRLIWRRALVSVNFSLATIVLDHKMHEGGLDNIIELIYLLFRHNDLNNYNKAL